MMVAGPSFLSLLLLLMGGQVGVPLGLPPLPEDPVMARVAPADCLWYFTWSGVAEPNPKSTNRTEQLLAEPEVRDFVHAVGKAFSSAIRKGAPQSPQGKILGAEGPGLIHTLLTHPTAAFVSKAGLGPLGLNLEGGIVVGTGNETDHVRSTLEKLEKTVLGPSAGKSAQAGNVQAAAAKWHKLPSPPGAPTLEWGFRDKYLIVGIGEGSADAIAKRAAGGQVPDWLLELKKRLPVERVSTVHYFNVKKALAAAAPLLGVRGQSIFEALGADKVQEFANVSGLDGTGCVSKSWLKIDGEPSGLFAVLGSAPLTAADLAPIPKDASFAVAARVQPAQVWKSIDEAAKKIDPGADAQLADGVKQMEAALGFRLQEDFLQTLGDSVCVYNSPGEGGLLITGLTIVVPVKDHDRLVKTNEQFVQFVRKNTAQNETPPGGQFARRGETTIRNTAFRNQKIFYLNVQGEELPFEPSWCITDTQLIFSLSPQNIRAFLSRDPAAGSLADLPAVAARIKEGKPVLLSYQDTAGMMKITYPVLQIFATVGFSQLQREGLDLDAATLPSLASLVKHVEPGISTLSRGKHGFLYVSRQSLPIDPTISGVIPFSSIFFLMSAREVSSARAQAVETEQEAVQARAEAEAARDKKIQPTPPRQKTPERPPVAR